MVDISSQNNKINVTVSSSGNTANTNVTPDYAQYYSEKSKEWAISNRIVDNTDYSSKYYANESKKQADISTAKTTEVVESGNNAVSNIESARDNAIMDVNTAGETQVNLAKEQATIATTQAGIAMAKTNEVIESGNNAITAITEQETTSKNNVETKGAEQIELIQNEGATQIANVQSTGFYMRDDKLYFINSQGEETEFKLDDIELNNPSFFGDSKYVPTKVNNLSWLKSEGQNNPKGTYPSFYDWILENVNKGTKNFKGKKLYQFKGNTTETETYTPTCFTNNPVVGTWFYGYSPFQPCAYVTQVNTDGSIVVHDTKVNKDFTLVFKQEYATGDDLLTDYDFYIDTENETFRLPLLSGDENKLGKFEPIPLPAFGSDFSNPYVNGMYEVFVSKSTNDGYLYIANRNTVYEDDNNTLIDGWGRVFCPANLGDTIYIETNIAEGGQRFARYAKYIGNGTLYYYVGETVQNANLIDAGRIGEILPTKLDASKVKAYIVETYRNGQSWYRIYSDGWCEQGGYLAGQGQPYGITTVTLLKPYKDINYWVQGNIVWGGDDWYKGTFTVNAEALTDIVVPATNRTRTSFDIQRLSSHIWYACGYIA